MCFIVTISLPEVAEDDNGNQYNAAHSDWYQQSHVVDLSIYVDWREETELKSGQGGDTSYHICLCFFWFHTFLSVIQWLYEKYSALENKTKAEIKKNKNK